MKKYINDRSFLQNRASVVVFIKSGSYFTNEEGTETMDLVDATATFAHGMLVDDGTSYKRPTEFNKTTGAITVGSTTYTLGTVSE